MKLLYSSISFVLLAAFSACRAHPPGAVSVPTLVAHVIQSVSANVPQTVEAAGTVHAKESAVISAQIYAQVTRVLVKEGDLVRSGQTLLMLGDAALRAEDARAQAAALATDKQRDAARTNAALAASTLARYQMLKEEKSVSPQEFDEVERRAQAAAATEEAMQAQSVASRATASSARTVLGYANRQAPFAGMVTSRFVDPGVLATPGMPLLRIDKAGPLQLQINIDASLIGSIHFGMTVPVTISEAGEQEIPATVAQILPSADPESHAFLAKLDLPQARNLRAGMYGTARIPVGTRHAILIPRLAIVERGGLSCVYVVGSDGIAQLRILTPGQGRGGMVEATSGIVAGETLVDRPEDRDFAGKRIEVQP